MTPATSATPRSSRPSQAAAVRHHPRVSPSVDPPNHPDQAPDILLAPSARRAAPDTWARIFTYTNDGTNGTLNWLKCSVPAADKAMDAGLAATTQADVQADYGKAGDLEVANGCFDSIADVKDVIVAQAGYSNWVHEPPALFTVRFGALKLSAG
jgi:peptide/nickel transport system substrate-binding protein